jgi:tetratricopeptide (TPR) repeat protein
LSDKKRATASTDQSFSGLRAFVKWLIVGIVLACAFAYGVSAVRVIVACLLFVWVLAGPFLFSWCLVDLASRAFMEGHYDLSEKLARLALAVDELVKPLVMVFGMTYSPFSLFNCLNLANALMVNGQFADSEAVLKQALKQTEALPDFQLSLTPLILSHMATVILYRGDFNQAEDLLERSTTIKTNRLQLNTLSVDERMSLELGMAADLYTTGGLFEKCRQYDLAEKCFKDALERVELFAENLDPDGELKSNFLNGLGDLYLKLGRAREAEPYIYEARRLRDQRFTADHPIMSSSYDNLGRFKTATGEYVEAEKWLEKARKIRQRYGRKNPADLADTMRSIGQLKVAEGKLQEAKEMFAQAALMKQKAFGESFPDVADMLEEKAAVMERLGDSGGAAAALEAALKIREKFCLRQKF